MEDADERSECDEYPTCGKDESRNQRGVSDASIKSWQKIGHRVSELAQLPVAMRRSGGTGQLGLRRADISADCDRTVTLGAWPTGGPESELQPQTAQEGRRRS